LPEYIFILQNIGWLGMKCFAIFTYCISSYRSETWADTNTENHSMGKTLKYSFAFCVVADSAEKRTSDSV